jgi:hypothetical protein
MAGTLNTSVPKQASRGALASRVEDVVHEAIVRDGEIYRDERRADNSATVNEAAEGIGRDAVEIRCGEMDGGVLVVSILRDHYVIGVKHNGGTSAINASDRLESPINPGEIDHHGESGRGGVAGAILSMVGNSTATPGHQRARGSGFG